MIDKDIDKQWFIYIDNLNLLFFQQLLRYLCLHDGYDNYKLWFKSTSIEYLAGCSENIYFKNT